MYTLKNKVAIITGGAEGIGFNIAEVFLKKEAKTVILLDINKDRGEAAIKKLNAKYGDEKVVFIKCDVTQDCEAIANNIIQKYRIIDILVNNAGICDEFHVQRCIDINVVAVINLTFKFYDHMRKDKGGNGGTIINISSTFGLTNSKYMPVYAASKNAIVAFSKSVGYKDNYKRTGVRVIVVCPGKTGVAFSDTMVDRDEELQKEWLDIVNDFPCQTHEEVAFAVAEVYEIAESGTMWRKVGADPVQEYLDEVKA